jgi:hypothetical protein
MLADQLDPVDRELVPVAGHGQELVAVLAGLHAHGELPALLGVFSVLGRFLHLSPSRPWRERRPDQTDPVADQRQI